MTQAFFWLPQATWLLLGSSLEFILCKYTSSSCHFTCNAKDAHLISSCLNGSLIRKAGSTRHLTYPWQVVLLLRLLLLLIYPRNLCRSLIKWSLHGQRGWLLWDPYGLLSGRIPGRWHLILHWWSRCSRDILLDRRHSLY